MEPVKLFRMGELTLRRNIVEATTVENVCLMDFGKPLVIVKVPSFRQVIHYHFSYLPTY